MLAMLVGGRRVLGVCLGSRVQRFRTALARPSVSQFSPKVSEQGAARLTQLSRRATLGAIVFASPSACLTSSATPSEIMTDASGQDLIAVYVTVPDMETGRKIGGELVAKKMAACVNVIPGLTSIYYWEGKVNEDSELLLMIKTRKAKLEALTEAVNSLHPYDVCEIIAVPIVGGSDPYLKWVVECTT
ncbi:hypothetical protein BSKO_07126 [Bryopsis sp. KO-2023]|nr:hypothetical protein BSKO_07126 [Bryopsis sp. KO-2023]